MLEMRAVNMPQMKPASAPSDTPAIMIIAVHGLKPASGVKTMRPTTDRAVSTAVIEMNPALLRRAVLTRQISRKNAQTDTKISDGIELFITITSLIFAANCT